MEILVVDIETTGFNVISDAIVEIGIVLVDTKTRQYKLIFDNIVKDSKFDIKKHSDAWIFKNSTLTIEEVENAYPLEMYLDELQDLFDNYKMTAYSKAFDMRFLKAAGLTMTDIEDLKKAATKHSKYITIQNRKKIPSVEEIYNQFFVFDDNKFVEKHRASEDALCESKILLHMVELKSRPIVETEKIVVQPKKKEIFKTLDIDDSISFGKYKGSKLGEVIKMDPRYLKWCLNEIPTFRITEELKKLII